MKSLIQLRAAGCFCLHCTTLSLHVETEGDVLFSLSRQCKQTCLRRRDICCMQLSSSTANPQTTMWKRVHDNDGASVSEPVVFPTTTGLAHRVPRALAQELLANSYQNRKLAWVRNGYNTTEWTTHSLHQHRALPTLSYKKPTGA